MTRDLSNLARLVVDYWKLLASFDRALESLPEETRKKSEAQLRYSRGRLEALLEETGLVLVTFDGKPFSAGLPASPINAEDFACLDDLIVDRTIDPAIVSNGNVVLAGKVLLGGG